MNSRKYILILICLIFCATVDAQRRRTRGRVIQKPKVTIAEVDSLIKIYKFEDASTALQALTNQPAAGESQEKYDSLAEKIRIGANMLSATAKVVFIDSFVVDKDKILSVIKLDKGCGDLDYWKNIFEANQHVKKDVTITTTYTNDFKDKLFYCYPDSTEHTKLFSRYLINEEWSAPESLGIGDSASNEAYPFMLSDGVTLYYSSTSSESLGGYDIYVTRYNTDTQKYLKSENMGMPYNSLYNDYFLAIDEANQLGWLVSDRYQPEGKVCVYLFVHDETRNVYSTDDDTDNLRHLAVIHDIASTQVENKNIAVAAKQRYKNLLASLQNSKEEKNEFTFPVYNGIVYHNMNDFKSSEAKQMATNWRELTLKRTAIITELSKNRKKYPTNTSLRGTIIKQENALEQLDDTIKDLEWNIRYEEQSKLGINNK